MMVCGNCGSTSMEYLGIEDGVGDMGTQIAEVWRCENCGLHESHYYTGQLKGDELIDWLSKPPGDRPKT